MIKWQVCVLTVQYSLGFIACTLSLVLTLERQHKGSDIWSPDLVSDFMVSHAKILDQLTLMLKGSQANANSHWKGHLSGLLLQICVFLCTRVCMTDWLTEQFLLFLTAQWTLQAVCLVPHKLTSPLSTQKCCGQLCCFSLKFADVSLCCSCCCISRLWT